jgi:hypothetical protein
MIMESRLSAQHPQYNVLVSAKSPSGENCRRTIIIRIFQRLYVPTRFDRQETEDNQMSCEKLAVSFFPVQPNDTFDGVAFV